MNKEIEKIIIELAQYDLSAREELANSGELHGGQYHPRMRAIHESNAAELSDIIDQFGFPSIDLVGEEAHDSAWLIIQHAVSMPHFVRKCFDLMTKMSEEQVSIRNLAYLGDRIAYFGRKPQKYGTQWDWNLDGVFSPWWIENKKEVDPLRQSLGLPTIGEVAEFYSSEEWTKSISKEKALIRRNTHEEWLKSLGWCTDEDVQLCRQNYRK